METTEFNQIKERVLNWPLCYREIEGKELIAQGKNSYSIGNATFVAEDSAAKAFDKFTGLKQAQSKVALASYGEHELTELRNTTSW